MGPGKVQLAIVLFDGLSALDVTAPFQCLQFLPQVETVFVGHELRLYKAASFSMLATHTFAQVPRPDIVLVPGGIGIKALVHDDVVLNWLRQVNETSSYMTGVGTGTVMLGAAGLLQGIPAATHWVTAEVLANYGVEVSNKRLVHQGKVLTASGPISGVELGLKLASLIESEDVARAVQVILDYEPRDPEAQVPKETAAKAAAHLAAHQARFSPPETNGEF